MPTYFVTQRPRAVTLRGPASSTYCILLIRTCLLLTAGQIGIARAQPSAVADDLEKRAIAARNGVERSESWERVLKSRQFIRWRIEESLHLNELYPVGPAAGFLYAPKAPGSSAPAILLLRPHQNLSDRSARILPTAIAQMGIMVLEIDTRLHHSRRELLPDGVVPQRLIQQDLRAAIKYLKARPDVDSSRLGLVGDSLVATVGAAINNEFSSIVLFNGAPDFSSVISELRVLDPSKTVDTCELIPGMLRYAATEELLALVVPRPLLLLNPAQRPLDYVLSLYRSSGAGQELYHDTGNERSSNTRFTVYAWLAKSLQSVANLTAVREPTELAEPTVVQLDLGASRTVVSRPSLSESLLASVLGGVLPEGTMTYSLNCRGNHKVDFYTQPGLKIPVTVLRPGPDGCGPSRGTLVAVDDRGRSYLASDEIVLEASRRGWIVWMIDPRGIGEMGTNMEHFVFAVSLWLKESFAWRQSADIQRVLRRVAGAQSRDPTALYARGRNMGLAAAYIAAIADQRELAWAVLRDAPSSLEEMTNASPSYAIPFDVLRSFNVVDLLRAARAKVFSISRPEEFLSQDW